MDDIVRQAMAKWPNVPDCYGWLALDARGDWYMRDERAQQAGPFPQVKGSRVEHDKLRAFIERNYACDAAGRWYFQNGPQRVYVELEAAPWVWRLARGTSAAPAGSAALVAPVAAAAAAVSVAAPAITSHTGIVAGPATGGAWLDASGRLFLATGLGLGLVHTLDVEAAADAIEAGLWTPESIEFAALPARFGYVLRPQPQP